MAALALLGSALAAAQPSFDVEGFTRPLQVETPSARECAGCHPAEFASWQRSGHRTSLTNPWFLDGFAADTHVRCVTCHAPLARQVASAWRSREHLRRGVTTGLSAHASEGITCGVCHVRNGVVLAANAQALPYAHPLAYSPGLQHSEFCATCHEFQGHAVRDGATVLNALPMQTTFSEWREWGGAKTCQGCHMPGGSHEMKGAHDVQYLRGALSLQWSDVGRATVWAHDVGHRVPTGDVFRHLVLWADDRPLQRWGLDLEPGFDDAGRPGLIVVSDTRLRPDAKVDVKVPAGTRRLRLTYHYTSPSPRERVGLSTEDEVVELFNLGPP